MEMFTSHRVLQKQRDFFNKSLSLLGGTYIRLGNYFNKRDAAAVIVRQRYAVQIVMDKLSRVFFKVYAVYANIFCFLFAVLLVFNGHKTVYAKGQIKL